MYPVGCKEMSMHNFEHRQVGNFFILYIPKASVLFITDKNGETVKFFWDTSGVNIQTLSEKCEWVPCGENCWKCKDWGITVCIPSYAVAIKVIIGIETIKFRNW